MRVLELGKHYPPTRGGMETALRQLCEALRRHGHRVLVLVAAEDRRGGAERVAGVAVRRLVSCGRIRSVPITPGLPAALRRARRVFRPDRVHLHLPNPGMALAWWIFGSRELPLVISYHSDIVRQRWLRVLLEPVRQRLLGRARLILVTSQALLEESRSLRPHRERCRVLPFGVEIPELPIPAPEDTPYFLFVGRLVYYKGLEVLLDALAGEPFRLKVVGDGPERARLEARVRRLGIEDRVRFLGPCDEDRLHALYLGCRALVLPSVAPSETFGLVQLEAMARARPVIASRASGGMVSIHREGETALLVAPGEVEPLREAMLRLWSDPELALRMGQQARAHVERHYALGRAQDARVAALEELTA